MKTKKILIAVVEDMFRRNMKRLLEYDGFQVLTAADGQEAIDIYQKNLDIDLVILDYHMPVLDGPYTCSLLKKENSELKVILFTNESYYEIKESYKEAGFNGFFARGYPEKLLTFLKT
jgi:CheY-like chemotaxis protein